MPDATAALVGWQSPAIVWSVANSMVETVIIAAGREAAFTQIIFITEGKSTMDAWRND